MLQVDRLIGKDHLFKRSIILVKAWCYYESRILGAHHGLISTYALETLVLYIFNLFHASIRGPFEVSHSDRIGHFAWLEICTWSNWNISRFYTNSSNSLANLIGNIIVSVYGAQFIFHCYKIWLVRGNAGWKNSSVYVMVLFHVSRRLENMFVFLVLFQLRHHKRMGVSCFLVMTSYRSATSCMEYLKVTKTTCFLLRIWMSWIL